jgi:hypothetical protein
MTTATLACFDSLISNPLLTGKEVKTGIHTISKKALSFLEIDMWALISDPKGVRLVTSPVKYWEVIDESFGVIVTTYSIYKVQVID